MPLISAIVLFHNEPTAREAVKCIEALNQQTIADQIEIIPVSNGALDSANALLPSNLSPLLTHKNIGYGAGNNAGVKIATGKYILIINPDNYLESNSLQTMLSFLQEHSDVGIVGPKLVFPDGSLRDSFRSFPSPIDIIIKRTPLRYIFKKRIAAYLQWNEDPETLRDVDWMCGACFLLSKKLYDELNGFDERFFLFFEDCDLCRRTWEKRLRVVYLPSAKANDRKQRLSGGGIFSIFTKKTVRIHVASAIKYFWKWRMKKPPYIS